MSLRDMKGEVRLVRPAGVWKGMGKTKPEVSWVPPTPLTSVDPDNPNVIPHGDKLPEDHKEIRDGPYQVHSHFFNKLIWLRSEHTEWRP